MLIAGVKVTHDGGVAVIDGEKLVASVETEKLDNGRRYGELGDLGTVDRVLSDLGIDPGAVDRWVVDGWGYGEADPVVTTHRDGRPVSLPVAPYREQRLSDDSLARHEFDGLPVGGRSRRYSSFHHTTGHVLAAYCASPYARRGEPSFVLVWDGGVLPRLYRVTPDGPRIHNLGPVLGLMGNVYASFALHFPPFRPADDGLDEHARGLLQLSVPGKVMAYTALGEVREDLCRVLDGVYEEDLQVSLAFGDQLARAFLERTGGLRDRPEDALASLQHWIGERLVASLDQARRQHPGPTANLCLSGGCALNIKWNSAIRRSGLFDSCWVPPFPNDSGSAVGAACAAMVGAGGQALDWSVYAGPSLAASADVPGWDSEPMSVPGLAALLHTTGEPVVVLHGRAELGPRALGNRSILAPATSAGMKDRLNEIKVREPYRPVSPICLEHRAPEVFDPGTPDPYMLFDHRMRPGWADRVPAVVHLDGTARLQTVNQDQNPTVAALLEAYEGLSGVPVLCNTSANLNGSGFFPDVASALRWGRVGQVWSEGRLWRRSDRSVEAR